MAKEFSYEITEEVGIIGDPAECHKEVNKISWNEGEPKLDIRVWSPNSEKMSKGISLDEDEAKQLYEILKGHYDG